MAPVAALGADAADALANIAPHVDAAATLATGDAFAEGAVPLEMQKAVGMGEFDAFAGDYSDVDASIPGLKPDVETEAKAERKAKAEKQAVQAQWRAKDADVRDVRAEYVKWMRANGKKAPARAARMSGWPGSEISGVPASLTSASVLPAASSARIFGRMAAALCS